MTHVREEVLAGQALGEPDELSRRERWHLGRCDDCSGRLSDLRRIVATGRSSGAAGVEPVRPPRPGLLAAIHAELDLDDAPAPVGPTTAPVTTTPVTTLPTRPTLPTPDVELVDRPVAGHRRRTRWLVAAAVVAAVGVTATVAYRQENQQVVATAVLAPLPTKAGSGTAEIVRGRDGQELSVSLSTTTPPDTFVELWLFDAATGGMISVGIVPPTGRGTFPLPAAGQALSAYTVVDVSQEPFDGNPAHSRNSILRGTLS